MVNQAQALIFGRNEGAPYHPLNAIADQLQTILEPSFALRFTDSSALLCQLGEIQPDLLIALDDNWNEALDNQALDSVKAWVQAGGRLLLIHNGICWARHPGWARLAGGQFLGHGPAASLTFTRKADHASFTVFEEPYRFKIPLFSGNRVLASYQDQGKHWPAFWQRRQGKGVVAYALPGHNADVYKHPTYGLWLLEFTKSLAGIGNFPGARPSKSPAKLLPL